MSTADQLYNTKELADFLGVSTTTVIALPIKRVNLSPTLFRYAHADVIEYLKNNTVQPEREANNNV